MSFTNELTRRLQNENFTSSITKEEFAQGLESGEYTQVRPFSTYDNELKVDTERGGVFVWSCRMARFFLIGKTTSNL